MKSWNQDTALTKLKLLLNNSYQFSELSESDTRSKIIDYILIDCLGWKEADIIREERCLETGRYLDYKLSTNLPQIIIEAKKNSIELQLPKASTHREYKIGGVLSNCENTISAMKQARDYAISKGITFCCVTNGRQFIFFRSQNQMGIDWVEHKALIFRDIKDIVENFDLFCLHLSKTSAEQGKIQKCLSPSKGSHLKENFQTLDTRHLKRTRKLDRNPLYPIIGEIVRKVFQDLASEDAESEVLEHCYVESPKKSDKRRPYLDRTTTPLDVSKKNAGDFQKRISLALNTTEKSHTEVILLLGSVGVGKSTFIQRFRKVLSATEIDKNGIWLYLNFKHFSDTGLPLDNFIYGQISDALSDEYSILGLQDWNFLKQAYHVEYERLKRGALQPLYTRDPIEFELEFGKRVDSWSETKTEEHFIKILSAAIKRKGKKVFLIFDNADQLNTDTQNAIFLAAEKLAERIGCFALISMREESYWKNRDSGPLNAFHTTAYNVQPATLQQVLAKRFQYAKSLISQECLSSTSESGITTAELLSIFDRLVQTLLGQDESYIEFIEATSSRDTRRALETIAAFLISGHTNIEAILRDIRRKSPKNFPIPFHEFLNAVVLRDHEVYTEESCDIFNLFEIDGNADSSNFNRIAVLGRVLASKNCKSDVGTGYTPIDEVVDDCHSAGILPDTTLSILAFLTSRRAIETETTIRDDISASSYVRITSSGEYYINKLSHLFGYLDLIIFQTPIRCTSSFKKISRAFNAVNSTSSSSPDQRLQRVIRRLQLVEAFIEYLDKEIVKSSFTKHPELFAKESIEIVTSIKAAFKQEKTRVIESAESVFGKQ